MAAKREKSFTIPLRVDGWTVARVDVPGEVGQTLHLQQSGLVQSTGVDVNAVAVGCRPVSQSFVELWSIKTKS